MVTLMQLWEVAQSPGHDGHIARVILDVIKQVKYGELTDYAGKAKIKFFIKNYRLFDTIDNYELLDQFIKSLNKTDIINL